MYSMIFDFTTDTDTHVFFEIVVYFMKSYFSHSEATAIEMLNQYYEIWKEIRDSDFYHHRGAYEIASRIHYMMALKGDEVYFMECAREHGHWDLSRKANKYFYKHYFDKM